VDEQPYRDGDCVGDVLKDETEGANTILCQHIAGVREGRHKKKTWN